MPYSIAKKQLSPQPVLVARRQVQQSEIAKAIGEALPLVFSYAHRNGIAIAGPPFARYPGMGPGLMTLDIGVPVAAAPNVSDSEVRADSLPGGPAAVTTHMGPYDQLPEAFRAIGHWIQEQGLTAAGAPWESYITDPDNYPDPKDWRTDVFVPLAG
ncbi:MAG: AraC family transcriptional regulator [Terriglobia bacterium]|nr:MAG: AraC family transcriptional regulator [Terriglobia bacterium]